LGLSTWLPPSICSLMMCRSNGNVNGPYQSLARPEIDQRTGGERRVSNSSSSSSSFPGFEYMLRRKTEGVEPRNLITAELWTNALALFPL
ncbi:MAG: hypothetical protein MIO92_09670, partial [Methanosarcinaceae archaeon]|nr:hypothetical protein [Methanosarcinaceae archaeon]